MHNRLVLLMVVAVIVGVSLGVFAAHQQGCPSVPAELPRTWKFLGCSAGVAHYVSSQDVNAVVRQIVGYYDGNILYYSYVAPGYLEENMHFPVNRDGSAALLIVFSGFGPVSYTIVSSNGNTHIFASATNVSPSVVPFSWKRAPCPFLGFSLLTDSMLLHQYKDKNVLEQYLQVQADLNSVLSRMDDIGRLTVVLRGDVGFTYVFILDNNVQVNVMPVEKNITGMVCYEAVRGE